MTGLIELSLDDWTQRRGAATATAEASSAAPAPACTDQASPGLDGAVLRRLLTRIPELCNWARSPTTARAQQALFGRRAESIRALYRLSFHEYQQKVERAGAGLVGCNGGSDVALC
jgi:hypothetical protein